MKKNLKFMLVALLAVFGFASASADELVNSTQYDTNGFQYVIKSMAKTAGKWSGTVSIKKNTFSGASITINPTVNITVEGTVSGEACSGTVTFDIVEIAENGFADLEDVTSITFADGCKITKIGAGAFAGTKIETLDLTNTKVEVLNKLFENGNTSLKKVILNASLTEIANDGLDHCFALSEIDASKATNLLTLGANCFGDNVVETLDLSNTKVANLSNNPFVGSTTGLKNKTLKTLTLPKTVETLGTGLANLYNLEEVNLQDTKITTVGDLAFENDKALPSLEFPNTLTAISTSAAGKEVFKGCAKLAELTFDYKALTTVGNGTNALFGEATAGDGTLAALMTLKFITEKPADNTFKANIGATAFANCTAITKVEIAVGGEIATGASLAANAIALSNTENSEVKLGKLSIAPTAAFIAGPAATGVEADVTIGDIAVDQEQETAIVSGNIGTFTVGKLTKALQVEAIGAAAKIVFGGDITAALTVATTRVVNSRLTEIDFGTIAITAAMFPAKAFDEDNAPNLVKATWTPTTATKAFGQATFGKNEVDALAKIEFTTTEDVAGKYPQNTNEPIVDKDLYNVVFKYSATPVTPEKLTIKVYGPEDGSSFIGYAKATGKNYKIAKKQGDATITVFSAFIDESDNKLYMDPLQIVDGNFIVKLNEVVIIRSNSSKEVEYTKTDDKNTMRYTWNAKLVNDLKFTGTAISADELGTKYYDKGQFIYRLDNPKTTGAVSFTVLSNTQYLPKNSVYTVRNGKAAEARGLDIVWLDGSENVTGIIENIADKKAVNNNNGVMYNLAGQKVGAGYKGIVIMNGKKMIQK